MRHQYKGWSSAFWDDTTASLSCCGPELALEIKKKKIHVCSVYFYLKNTELHLPDRLAVEPEPFFRVEGGCERTAWNATQPNAQSHPPQPGGKTEAGSLRCPPRLLLTTSVSTTFMFRDWPFWRFEAWFLLSAFTDQWLCGIWFNYIIIVSGMTGKNRFEDKPTTFGSEDHPRGGWRSPATDPPVGLCVAIREQAWHRPWPGHDAT